MPTDFSATVTSTSSWNDATSSTESGTIGLVVGWAIEEPERIGEVALVERKSVLGRGDPDARDAAPRLTFSRRRPGSFEHRPALASTRVSRTQLELNPLGDGSRLYVRSVGRCPMLVRGEVVDNAILEPGDTLVLKNTLVLVVVRVPPLVKVPPGPSERAEFPFGKPDAHGITGESSAVWALREHLAFAAQSGQHVLLLGPSGTGKELAARAIHGLSSRQAKRFIARNAATFPEGLVDAELFGTAKGYPNAGTPERPGLIAEADKGTLFLDEIGELAPHLQAHLLRVLDRGGEFQRLGESHVRRADVRIVAATNRPIEQLKHDFAARFAFRVHLPPLERRREDIPLLILHLLHTALQSTPAIARFFETHGGQPSVPRIDCQLVDALMRHTYTLHVRELERFLWVALASSPGNYLALTSEVRDALQASTTNTSAPVASTGGSTEIDRARVESALANAQGNITEAAQKLGLKNRFALYRLMKKLGIASPNEEETE